MKILQNTDIIVPQRQLVFTINQKRIIDSRMANIMPNRSNHKREFLTFGYKTTHEICLA